MEMMCAVCNNWLMHDLAGLFMTRSAFCFVAQTAAVEQFGLLLCSEIQIICFLTNSTSS